MAFEGSTAGVTSVAQGANRRDHRCGIFVARDRTGGGTRGLDLATGDSPVEELAGARFLLTYAYLALDDYYRAAVVGEDLARTRPRAPQAPLAAAYALRSYSLLIAKEEEAGAAKEDMEPDRARLAPRRVERYYQLHRRTVRGRWTSSVIFLPARAARSCPRLPGTRFSKRPA